MQLTTTIMNNGNNEVLEMENPYDMFFSRIILPEKLSFKKGDRIYFKGGSPEGLYLVRSGKVKINLERKDGKNHIIRIAFPNDFIGQEYLFSDSRHISSAVALENAQLDLITMDDFVYAMKRNEKLMEKMFSLLAGNMLAAEKKVFDNAYKPVMGRLADALIELDELFGNSGSETIPLTRAELASYVGSVRETINRMLIGLKSKNIIEINENTLRVLNKHELIKISNAHD